MWVIGCSIKLTQERQDALLSIDEVTAELTFCATGYFKLSLLTLEELVSHAWVTAATDGIFII